MSISVSLNSVYEILQRIQKKLHSEQAMSSTLDELFNQNFLRDFKNKIVLQLIDEKHFYARILLMVCSSNIKKAPFKNLTAFYSEKLNSIQEKIPKQFEIIQKETNESNFSLVIKKLELEKLLDSTMINIITFSIIPSFYLMFLESSFIDSFCDLIQTLKSYYVKKEIKRPLHYKLSRSLFISPMFLFFIRQVMHGILQPIFKNSNSKILKSQIQNIKEKIKKSFEDNAYTIPSYVQVFLNRMNDTFNFLKKCLFNPLIINPAIFLVIDLPSELCYKSQMESFKNILKLVFDNKLISEISQCIDQNKDSQKAYFTSENDNKFNFDIKIIDTVDKFAFDLIKKYIPVDDNINQSNDSINCNSSNNNSNNDNGNENINNFNDDDDNDNDSNIQIDLVNELSDQNYDIYEAYINNKSEMNSPCIHISTIFKPSDSYWVYFRKLLKDAQPLPINQQLSNELLTYSSFLEMIRTFLVDTCEPSTIVDATISYDLFEKGFKSDKNINIFNSEIKFESAMENLITEHKEQFEAMQMISRFITEIIYLKEMKILPIKMIENVFNSRIIDTFLDDTNLPTGKEKFDMIANPLKYNYQFEEYLKIQSKKAFDIIGSHCNTIFYNRFFKDLTFYTFLSCRPEVRKLDLLAKDLFSKFNRFEDFVVSKKHFKLYNNLHILSNFIVKLKEVMVSDINPLDKHNEIALLFQQINFLAEKHFGLTGPDDISSFIFYLVPLINPSYYISNLIFMSEFIFYRENSFVESLNVHFFTSAFKNICELDTKLQSFSYLKFSRANCKYIELIFTGNDSNLIISAFKQFALSINKETKFIDDLNLLNKIEANPGHAFPLKTEFQNIKKKNIHIYFVANIKIGKNIPLAEEKVGSHVYRSAIFCYKTSPGFNIPHTYPSDIRPFLNDSKVPNQNKVVFHDENDPLQFSLPTGVTEIKDVSINIADINESDQKENDKDNIIQYILDPLSDYLYSTLKELENPSKYEFPVDDDSNK